MDKYREIEPAFQADAQKILLEWEIDDAEIRADYAARVEQNAMEAFTAMAEFLRSGEIEKRAAALRWFNMVEDWMCENIWFSRYESDIRHGKIVIGANESHFTDSCMVGEH